MGCWGDRVIPKKGIANLTTVGHWVLPQVGKNEKSTPSEFFDKIYFDGFHPFKEVFIDDISDPFQSKSSVVFPWFILNQTQGGPCSAILYCDANRRNFLFIPQHFLDRLSGPF
jgi:hypothetical protein